MQRNSEIHAPPFYLRPLTPADLDEIHTIWTNKHVRKYLFDDEVISPETTLMEIRESMVSFEKYGYGLWAVFLAGKKNMIGFTGYRIFEGTSQPQLLYGLLPKYIGKGYATRLAKLMIQYGFEQLNFSDVYAGVDAPNLASIRVLSKAGMKPDRQIAGKDPNLLYFRIKRPPSQKQKRQTF